MRWVWRILFSIIVVTILAPLGLWMTALTRETDFVQDLIPAEGRLIETRLGQIYIEEKGPPNGPPVVLLHGAMAWSGLWRETSMALSQNGYRVIAFDIPPFGFSDRDPNADYSIEKQAKRINALNFALDIKPVLVAHSSGVCAGITAAVGSPESLKGVILVNAAIGNRLHERLPMAELPTQPWWLRTAAIAVFEINPWRIQSNFDDLLHNKQQAALYLDILKHPLARQGTTAAISDWYAFYGGFPATPHCIDSNTVNMLYGLEIPLGIVWGLEDQIVPIPQGYEMAWAIPLERKRFLENAGHAPHIDQPEKFHNALLEVLGNFD